MTLILPAAIASMPSYHRVAYRLAVMRDADAASLADLEAVLRSGIGIEPLALAVFASKIGQPVEESPEVRAKIADLGFPEDELAAFYTMLRIAATHTPASERA